MQLEVHSPPYSQEQLQTQLDAQLAAPAREPANVSQALALRRPWQLVSQHFSHSVARLSADRDEEAEGTRRQKSTPAAASTAAGPGARRRGGIACGRGSARPRGARPFDEPVPQVLASTACGGTKAHAPHVGEF